MLTQNPRRQLLPTNSMVCDKHARARAKIVIESLGLTSRKLPDNIQDMLLRFDMRDVELWTQPELVPVPLIDDEWAGDERYLREFMKNEECKYPLRDRWIFLYLSVEFPELYRHVIR